MADEEKKRLSDNIRTETTSQEALPEVDEILTDLEKRINQYKERAEISYQKKEANIRKRNAKNQQVLKAKLERLAAKEERKLKKIEIKLQHKDPKWKKQHKLELQRKKKAKKLAKKNAAKKRKQIKKQKAQIKKMKRVEAKKQKKDYQYQFSLEAKRVQQRIAELESKTNQKIESISAKEVSQIEKIKAKYEKMVAKAIENIRKNDPNWAAVEKAKQEKNKEEAKKKKEAAKAARAEQKAALKIKSKETKAANKEKRAQNKGTKVFRRVKRQEKKKAGKGTDGEQQEKKKKLSSESVNAFLSRFDYVLLRNGKTVNLLIMGLIIAISLLTLIGSGTLLWQKFGPVPPHKVVDRYLAAFQQRNIENMDKYGSSDYSFISDKIMTQDNYWQVKAIMQQRVYDIDYEIASNGRRVGEQMKVEVTISNYDLGTAMTRGLERYREENYLAYFSGKYTAADLEDSLIEILQETLVETTKDHTETIPVYLQKNGEDKWQVADLGSGNPYLTKMLTGCVYLPLVDDEGEVIHIPYTAQKVWMEETPAYQELLDAMNEILKPENAISVG